MPYSVDNPPTQLKGLAKHLIEIFVAAFNAALKQYGDEGKAAAVAWAAGKTKDHKNDKGDWVANEAKEENMPTITEATKSEDGVDFPSSDYAYCPDPDKPSEWKLRLTSTPGGEPDSGIVGAACAALGKGFRGQKVEIPAADLPGVKAKVRAAWKKANPDKDPDEMPPVIKEAISVLELAGDYLALVESKGDAIKVKVIQPGWGSSGYYPESILERDAGVYKTGTMMFWDHPTLTEEKDRPERSLRDLAGVLVSDGRYEKNGKAGAGIYADAKVFGGYKDAVAELGPHIGVSHIATGKAKKGEAEGQKGNIIEQITAAHSVDFVTSPGAGGKILQLFEAARGMVVPIKSKDKEETDMTAEETKAFEAKVTALEAERDGLKVENETLKQEVARYREGALLAEAQTIVADALKEPKLPDVTKARLSSMLGKNPPVKDGKLDTETLKVSITEAIKAESEYLAKVVGSGQIKGMGSTPATSTQSLKDAFKGIFATGRSMEEADRMAEIAAQGR